MEKERQTTESDSETVREPFVTIDDLVVRADELAGGLRTLSEYKHPLDIRRGRKRGEGVSDMAEEGDSRTVKAGARTYFFDLKETKDGKPYLLITESRFKGEDKKRQRVSFAVFPEQAEAFNEAVSDMTAKLN